VVEIPLNPAPEFAGANATTLPAGSNATASIDNTDPQAPVLNLGLPRGADGKPCFTNLAVGFTMPLIGGSTTIVVGDNSWAQVGRWVHIDTAGHFVVSGKSGTTGLTITNPSNGELDGLWGPAPNDPPYNGAWFIGTNALPGTSILTSDNPAQVCVCGPPGARGPKGEDGVDGDNPYIETDSDDPVTWNPPIQSGSGIRISTYGGAFTPFQWDGVSWQQVGPNLKGPSGATVYSGSTPPSTLNPVGANPGDQYLYVQPNALSVYSKVGSSWVLSGGMSLLGTNTEQHTQSSPGLYTIRAENFSHTIEAGKDIVLEVDDTAYSGQGEWTVLIRNMDVGSIDFGLFGLWEQDPAMVIPASIPSGDVLLLKFIRNMFTGAYIITAAYFPEPATTGS
jgi:hypothetical protein